MQIAEQDWKAIVSDLRAINKLVAVKDADRFVEAFVELSENVNMLLAEDEYLVSVGMPDISRKVAQEIENILFEKEDC
jgi:hypothetical protein